MKRLRIRYVLFLLLFLIFVSCLKDAPESLPTEFNWDPEIAFPVGETSLGMNSGSGFDTTLLNINDSTHLPFWVDEIDIPIEGETSFDLGIITGDNDQVISFMIRVNAFNEFPTEVLLQAYFNESEGVSKDSMFLDGPMHLPPGTISGSGKSASASYTLEDAIFTEERINNLESVSEISFRALILNAEIDSTLVEFYPTYEIDIQLGAIVKLNL